MFFFFDAIHRLSSNFIFSSWHFCLSSFYIIPFIEILSIAPFNASSAPLSRFLNFSHFIWPFPFNFICCSWSVFQKGRRKHRNIPSLKHVFLCVCVWFLSHYRLHPKPVCFSYCISFYKCHFLITCARTLFPNQHFLRFYKKKISLQFVDYRVSVICDYVKSKNCSKKRAIQEADNLRKCYYFELNQLV